MCISSRPLQSREACKFILDEVEGIYFVVSSILLLLLSPSGWVLSYVTYNVTCFIVNNCFLSEFNGSVCCKLSLSKGFDSFAHTVLFYMLTFPNEFMYLKCKPVYIYIYNYIIYFFSTYIKYNCTVLMKM